MTGWGVGLLSSGLSFSSLLLSLLLSVTRWNTKSVKRRLVWCNAESMSRRLLVIEIALRPGDRINRVASSSLNDIQANRIEFTQWYCI